MYIPGTIALTAVVSTGALAWAGLEPALAAAAVAGPAAWVLVRHAGRSGWGSAWATLWAMGVVAGAHFVVRETLVVAYPVLADFVRGSFYAASLTSLVMLWTWADHARFVSPPKP